jgi:hypothetical protein
VILEQGSDVVDRVLGELMFARTPPSSTAGSDAGP